MDPVHRLIVPRILAAIVVAVLLNGFVSVAGIAGGYVFNVLVQGGTPGAYLASFSLLAQPADLYVALMKAGRLRACGRDGCGVFRHVSAKPGRKASARPSTAPLSCRSCMIFVVNFVMTAIYFALVPPKFA